jgi:Porin subfamily
VHESFYGAYAAVSYGTQANNMLCSLAGNGAGAGTAAVATAGCNNNWSTWGVGSRLQWDVTKSFYLGVDVLYTGLDGGKTSDGLLHGYATSAANVTNVADSVNTWVARVRIHKDFLP